MGDADDSYDFTQLGDFVCKLDEGYDLVMGNRFQGGILPGAMPLLHRFLGNPVLSGWEDCFSGVRWGFPMWVTRLPETAIENLDLRTLGMEFSTEMVVKATLFNLRIAEIPTVLSPDGRDRPPHLRTWRDGWRYLRFLLLYSPRWLFLYPGIALFLLGIGISVWLLPGQRAIGKLIFDYHTLLFGAMAILVGFQSVNFAAFSKIFATAEGLLPEDLLLNRLYRYITLEVGLIVGALLVLAGAAMWVLGLSYWQSTHFGHLDPEKTLRIVIPGFVSLILGIQIILSSFFMSLLQCVANDEQRRVRLLRRFLRRTLAEGLAVSGEGRQYFAEAAHVVGRMLTWHGLGAVSCDRLWMRDRFDLATAIEIPCRRTGNRHSILPCAPLR